MRFDSITNKKTNRFKDSVSKLTEKYKNDITVEKEVTKPNIRLSDVPKININDIAEQSRGGITSAQIRKQANLMQQERIRAEEAQKAREEAEWHAKTPIQKVGTVVGKTLATPVAAMGELGTGVARAFEGFMDLGITGGGVGIGAMRKKRLENSQIMRDKLLSEGKISQQEADEWQRKINEEKIQDQEIDKATAKAIEYPIAENLLGKANREFTEKYSYLPTKAADISKTVGTILPSIGTGSELMASKPLQALAGTGKFGSKLASTASMIPFMGQATGMSTEEALREGADLQSAAKYGVLSGVVEGTIEAISGGIGGTTSNKLISKLAPETISKISNKVIAKYLPKLLDAGIDLTGEGAEEWLSTFINPYIKRLTYDEKAELSTSEERMEAFIDGVLASMVLKGATSLSKRTTPEGRIEALPEIDINTQNQLANINKNIEYQKQNEALANKQIQESVQNAKNNIENSKTTLTLPEGNRFYADEKGNVVTAQNYVAPRGQVQNQNSPVNTKQTIIDVQNNSQNDLLRQINTTLPTQAEMTQKANTEQIADVGKMVKKNDNFHKGLEKFNSKKYTQTDDMVVLDETPQYLYNLGFDADKPLVINMSKLETIMKEPKGTFDGKNQHGITMDVVEQLPKALQNPLNVIKNPKHNERVVVVTELTDQYGDIIIVPIEMNTDGYIENIENDVNRINTVYGKENYDIPKEGNDKGYIQYNEDKIIYDIDKDITKKRDINSDYRLQLPSTAINISNNSINLNDKTVNTEYAQTKQNDTADTQSAFSMPKNSLLNEIAPIDEKQLENVEEKETTASILTKSPKRPAKDLLKQSKDVFMRKLVDAGNTINTVGKLTGDKHLYEYFNNTKQARQSAEYMIGEAQTDIKGNRVGDSLINVFEEVRSKGDTYTNEFFEYLLHMHNIDRMAQNKPVFGESVKAEDSQRIANELLEKHPEFEKHAKKVYAYNKNLMQWRVDSGLISKEQADLMNEMYPHYVPTFRDVSGTSGSRAMQNTVQIANTVRKAKGSNKDIMPIDASMARQTMQTVQAAKRNLLGNRLLNDALNNKDKVGEYIQAVEKTTDKADLETDLDTPKDTNLTDNNNVFKIFRNGETYVMQVNNGIYEGLKSISSEIDNTDTNLILKPVKAANNMFKKLITGYSPMFSLKNFSRDIQDSGLYSKELREFIKKYPNTYKEMISNGKMWQLYKSLGGTGSSFFDYETGIEKTLDRQNKTSTKIKDATLGKVEELNMMIEQAPRFAEFMATIEKVGNQNYDTLMEAMLNAADITVNFGRSGTWGKALNATAVPFFNPSIQGFDKFARTVLESRDGKKFAKLAIRATLLGILPSVINELLYWDDEEYENLTDRDKDTNFLIKVDDIPVVNKLAKNNDNKWLKIPKGRVLSIFGNTAARGLRTLKGEEWDVGEFFKNQASQTAPISVLESNIASPIQAVKNNKTWYGSDIVPQRLQDYAPKDQYDENTDVFSKWLGSKINYSPKKINYLIDAYTGIIGDVVLPLTTPKAETNPFTKAFVVDGVTSNEISNDFYNMLDKYNPKQNPKKSAKEVSRYLNKQSSQVSNIYKQIREVENSDISDDEKRKQVRELRELANTIELTAMAIVPEYEKAVDKYRGTFEDEDVDSDYAYLFANRDIFGAEYAVKTFSKSLYNNHKNENMDSFFRSYFTRAYFQEKLEPEKNTLPTLSNKKYILPTMTTQRAKLPSMK